MNLDKYKDPITTSENINEIHFSADGLSRSYEYGEWTPGTDSYLGIIGLQVEEDGKFNLPVRKIIGESY